MRTGYANRLMLVAAGLLLLAVGACGPAADGDANTPLTEEQVTAMAENLLQAYNSGDYAAFSRDWVPAAQALLGESTFQELRDEAIAATGEFVAIESVEPLPAGTEGHARWSVTARFQNTTQTFTLTIDEATGSITQSNIIGIEF